VTHEDLVEERRERARVERFAIRSERAGEFRVASPSGYFYNVILRSLKDRANSCDCPDFIANHLGTCKHIEAILLKVRRARWRPSRGHAEIYLEYGPEVRIRATGRAAKLLGPEFHNGASSATDVDRFPQLLAKLRALDGQVTVRPDVLEHVTRELELREGLREEQRLLARLDRWRAPLKIDAYPFQKRGILFAACRERTMIADDMGLGKTAQAIGAAGLLAQRRGIREALVVCPASVKYQWEREIRRFCDLPAVVIDGGRIERESLYASDAFFKIVNYEALVRDRQALSTREIDLVILDEAQRIKNWRTKTARVVKGLRKRYALVLTGTPLENRLEELFSIVQFLDNRLLGPMWKFEERHLARDERGHVTGYRNLDEIRRKLAPIVLRRRKEEVLTELPPRVVNNVFVGMTPQQLDPYGGYARTVAMILQKPVITDVDSERLMIALNCMRMLCDSTYLLDPRTSFGCKIEEFREVVSEIAQSGHKVLVFSCWERMTRLAAQELEKLGIAFVRYHGRIPPRDRRHLVDRFMGDDACRVFLSTDAGGVGLNLQAASYVVNLDLPWNPAVLEQRIGRAHRMGQRRTVNVVNIVARDTIEHGILEVMKLKRELFRAALEDGPDAVTMSAGGRRQFLQTVRRLATKGAFAAPAPEPKPAVPGAELATALSALAKGLRVEAAGDNVRVQLELPKTQAAAVRTTLVPLIRSVADALIGALGG